MAAIGAIISAVAAIYGGVEQKRAATKTKRAKREQALLAMSEAEQEAERIRTETEEFKQRQKLAFLKSGITLEGSPLLTLAETEEIGEEQAQAVLKRGRGLLNLGTTEAEILGRQGRSAMWSSIGQGLGRASSIYGTRQNKTTFLNTGA